jgi:hypothetical protein
VEDFRRLTCMMMMDADRAAVSPSSMLRVLSGASRLRKWAQKHGKTAPGLSSRSAARTRHIDVAHINIHAASNCL